MNDLTFRAVSEERFSDIGCLTARAHSRRSAGSPRATVQSQTQRRHRAGCKSHGRGVSTLFWGVSGEKRPAARRAHCPHGRAAAAAFQVPCQERLTPACQHARQVARGSTPASPLRPAPSWPGRGVGGLPCARGPGAPAFSFAAFGGDRATLTVSPRLPTGPAESVCPGEEGEERRRPPDRPQAAPPRIRPRQQSRANAHVPTGFQCHKHPGHSSLCLLAHRHCWGLGCTPPTAPNPRI